MGACGADDDVGVLLRQKFKKQRFQMIDDSGYCGAVLVSASERPHPHYEMNVMEDELSAAVDSIVRTRWDLRAGQVIPETDDITLGNSGQHLVLCRSSQRCSERRRQLPIIA